MLSYVLLTRAFLTQIWEKKKCRGKKIEDLCPVPTI